MSGTTKAVFSFIAMNLGMLLGRLSGFGREALIANQLGASSQADVAILALLFPDLLANLLAGGAMGQSLFRCLVETENKRLRYCCRLCNSLSLVKSIGIGITHVQCAIDISDRPRF